MGMIYCETGTDATQGFEFWTSTFGTVASDTAQPRTGPRSIKCTTSQATVEKDGILAAAGRRISFGYRLNELPTTSTLDIALCSPPVFCLRITTGGIVQLSTDQGGGTQIGSNGPTLSAGTTYRFTLAYTITSTTVYSVKVYVDGVEAISASNSPTLSGSAPTALVLGRLSGGAAGQISWVDDVYVDDGTDLGDPGASNPAEGVHVTAKLPAANNTNSFDTNVGANPSNRWENVDDRPLSATNGWQHAAVTDVQENYGLQAAAVGDVDLTGVTLLARTAWLWAKRATPVDITAGNAGAEASAASGGITLGAPASPQNPSVWIAVIHSADQVAHTLTDWTQIAQFNGGGTGSRLSVWYFQYVGSNPNLVVGHTAGATIVGGIKEFRGVKTGNPVNTLGAEATGTGTQTGTGITPGVDGCAVLFCTGRGDDDNYSAITGYTIAFEDAAGGTQNNYQSSAGTPDCSMGMYYQIQTTLAATGTLTATTAATDPWASIIIALQPADTLGSPDIMDNGSETAIVLTASSALYTKITDSASYPSNAAGIGMRSGGGGVDTFLYECGTLIAYIPAVVQSVRATVPVLQAIQRASFR